MSRHRSWCFTVNNYSTDEYENLKVWIEQYCTYGIIGLEVGESGTPHLQGYLHRNSPGAMSSLKKLSPRAHWEVALGSAASNKEYCSKDGDIWEYGTLPEQGKRKDITSMVEMIGRGATDKEIYLEHGDKALRIGGCLARARAALIEQKRNWEMDVRIYFGPPGTGKTRAVFDEFGVDNVYCKMVGKWWDGYKGEQVVLIDDFDPDGCFDITFDFYLKLLDRYPMRIEYKGGSCEFYSRIIIFTSNFHPEDWFKEKYNRAAFFRRINTFREFGTEVEEGNTDASSSSPIISSDDVDEYTIDQLSSSLRDCGRA